MRESFQSKTISNPARGVLGLVAFAIEFAQRGWRGELLLGDKQYRSYRSDDRVKRSAVKSSTMKGPIKYVREGLPVRFCEDWSGMNSDWLDQLLPL